VEKVASSRKLAERRVLGDSGNRGSERGPDHQMALQEEREDEDERESEMLQDREA